MKARFTLPAAFLVLFAAAALAKGLLAPEPGLAQGGEPEVRGTFPPKWIAGLQCDTDPKIQVHAFTDDLYILRQSKCTHFEAPFVYVIFGREKALVIDTGSFGGPGFGEVVYGLVESWSRKNGVSGLEVVVAHSHSHSDHIQGDGEFGGRPNTTLVPLGLSAVLAHFGFDAGQFPVQEVTYDLGGRVLDVMTTPGHSPTSLTFYDRRTRVLLTGDLVYPGHLFVFSPQDWPVFRASIDRLLDFAGRNPVEWVLGCHIEWSAKDGGCYTWGTASHPNERVLQLRPQVLKEIRRAAEEMGDDPRCGAVQKDFVIHPVWLCPISAGC